ncbi:hypothetical protein SAMN05216410_3615 [Sanguibacter gelidistatuariae]|uniref:SnoaL-like domain-containing protein n=1 Tax=Sanguibacter gelidistatuariae TaxID=1814289 RepID=A0A1G6WFZ6_9MICO|nr:hypothetical protein [Sanguibacter gelidistatuariae]SDD63995.1 hypothetical protein SAMN05216410_3615 [Sanguibacter gelidistatuariae]
MTAPDALTAFLERYEERSNANDASGTAALFAATFLAGSGNGAVAVPNEVMAGALTRRSDTLEQAGLRSTRLTDWTSTPLGGGFSLLHTNWLMTFDENGIAHAESAEFPSTMLVHDDGKRVEICFYLAHGDIDATIARRTAP